MSDTNYTPRPWKVGRKEGDWQCIDGGMGTPHEHYKLAKVVVGIEGRAYGMGDANAHLIAAAPDLYEALAAEVSRRARTEGSAPYQCGSGYEIGDSECHCDDCGLHRTSVEALAKARGETP